MGTVIMVAQLVLALVILIGLHEFGHMIAAKAFGMRVEKFYIGFPPKLFGFKKGETEYSLGAIPLGGFVKITGMIDESLDTESLSKEPEPYEFRAKPAWQRLIVMLGGIIMNVILGVLVFIGITYYYGETDVPKEEIYKYGIQAEDLGQQLGFETGDKIIAVNGADYENFSDLVNMQIFFEEQLKYTVVRGDDTLKIGVPSDFLDQLSESKSFITYRWPFRIGRVEGGSFADEAGLKPDDKIIAINGEKVALFDELQAALQNNAGQEVSLKVERDDEVITLQSEVSETGTLGFYPVSEGLQSTRNFSLGESIPIGTKLAFSQIGLQVKAFGKMFAGDIDPRKSMSGPIKIAQSFGEDWIWSRFWGLVGLISMVLAFMNLLPIPALDGGHVAFLSYEIISGRKPSDKFLENAQKVGMVLLLALMAFILGNDIISVI
ncbi:RIP metalloprotease RseP [Roseivirga sp. BDSF3-8]|uniref:RIP metalloprotease RseP n=1 Tax=Roseivirga sp. BDSF3-8 TaxID=3241598 RepID=UPI003531C317